MEEPPKGKKLLVTSALPYVNNVPHLGNIIGSVLSADVFVRYSRKAGREVLFVGGTDEFGTTTELKAKQEGTTPAKICEKYWAIHKQTYEWFGIAFDTFGRSSNSHQTEVTHEIFKELQANGYTFEATTQQHFCEACNKFLADRFVEGNCPNCGASDARGDQCDACGHVYDAITLTNPRCVLDRSVPVVKPTTHIFLDLPRIVPRLEKWLASSSVHTWSAFARTWTKSLIAQGLQPRCITRDLTWGTPVPVPGFEAKVFYVWFDACIAYISITAEHTSQWRDWWNRPDEVELVQFMGKDNIPFHAILFPCSLLGTDNPYTLVSTLSTTHYLNFEGGKFSKSRGVGLFGPDAMDSGIPAEVWRFSLLTHRPETSDSNFSLAEFRDSVNGILIANLGNFVHRTLSLVVSLFEKRIPRASLTPGDLAFMGEISKILTAYHEAMASIQLRKGLELVFEVSRCGNTLLSHEKPWIVIKEDKTRAASVVALCANLVLLISQIVSPFLPSVGPRIAQQLCVTEERVMLQKFEMVLENHVIGEPVPLFREISEKQLDELRARFGGNRKTVSFSKDPRVSWPCVIVELLDISAGKSTKASVVWQQEQIQALSLPQIAASAQVLAYQGSGHDTGQICSVLNLVDILRQRGRLPSVNGVVDVYNVLSLKHQMVMGAYDVNRIHGHITFTVATGTETFIPVGEVTPVPVEAGEWILKDEKDLVVTKLVSKQSQQSCVQKDTTHGLMCIQGNPAIPAEILLAAAVDTAQHITKFCGGTFRIIYPQ